MSTWSWHYLPWLLMAVNGTWQLSQISFRHSFQGTLENTHEVKGLKEKLPSCCWSWSCFSCTHFLNVRAAWSSSYRWEANACAPDTHKDVRVRCRGTFFMLMYVGDVYGDSTHSRTSNPNSKEADGSKWIWAKSQDWPSGRVGRWYHLRPKRDRRWLCQVHAHRPVEENWEPSWGAKLAVVIVRLIVCVCYERSYKLWGIWAFALLAAINVRMSHWRVTQNNSLYNYTLSICISG